MNKILGFFFALTVGVVIIASISADSEAALFDAEEQSGVYCEINEVKLFAASADDCAKAGGKVTHTISTEVKEVEADNPNQEPEIQRTKDKQPEAP